MRVGVLVLGMIVGLFAGDTKGMYYDVFMEGKKVGGYYVKFNNKVIITKSIGTASKVKLCVDKKVVQKRDGYKVVAFGKKKSKVVFDVTTKQSALSTEIKKALERRLKKVKQDEILHIRKVKKGSNPRTFERLVKKPTIVFTFDELLRDIIHNKKSIKKLMLFDNSGSMKRLVSLDVSSTKATLINLDTNKVYLEMKLVKGYPVEIVNSGKWTLKALNVGALKSVTLKKKTLEPYVLNSLLSLVNITVDDIKNQKIKSKKSTFSLYFSLKSDCDMSIAKVAKNINGKSGCSAKYEIKKDKKTVLKLITKVLKKEYVQLKYTKDIKSKKGKITYNILPKVKG